MVAITIPQHANELSIFGTLNLDLSPMDKLKLDFGNLFTCQNSEKYDKIVDQWNNMYQDIGEDFPNILETIYQLIHINVNTSSKKNILNEIAENLKSNLEDVELFGEIFLNNYMNPIYIGHKSLKDVKTRPSFSDNADNYLINKMISRAVFIGENCLPKTLKIESDSILIVLIGICHCKAEGKKFLNYDVSSIPLATVRRLTAVWCHHVLLTCLMGEVNVKFSHMLIEISELLKGDNKLNFILIKDSLIKPYAKSWEEKMKRQINPFKNSQSDKKRCDDLERVFSTILPIINDFWTKKMKPMNFGKFTFCSIMPLKNKMGNKFYQVGNFTLGKSISDDTNNEERLEQFKKNKLKINSQFVNLTKLEEFTESMCEKRTEELLRIIKEIIKEIEQFEDEEQ